MAKPAADSVRVGIGATGTESLARWSPPTCRERTTIRSA
jgi:hypothetical protein